jgi:hypothetical protein
MPIKADRAIRTRDDRESTLADLTILQPRSERMLHSRLAYIGAHVLIVAGLAGCGTSEPPPAAADASIVVGLDGGLGPADFGDGELDAPSNGGTITFQSIGLAGWYPSRRDPASGDCDAYQTDTCCLARQEVTSDRLTPWDEDLILTLRGPMQVKQLAVYQPAAGGAWSLVSAWDARAAGAARGLTFSQDFAGAIGTECLVDVASDTPFACGPGSQPFCPGADAKHLGWSGSKLYVLLARMPHAGETPVGSACSTGTDGNWYDAPWLGLSLGELVRAGAFSDCHCYAKDPAMWWLGDGCGQFNVFEVVNDHNTFTNLDVFSTNFFGYAGYVGEGPCGAGCDVATLPPTADLIDKANDTEAAAGALASPSGGPGAAFRRPAAGYRYFVVLLDVPTRTVQLALVHPSRVPAGLAPLLPALPASIDTPTIDALRGLRLPH